MRFTGSFGHRDEKKSALDAICMFLNSENKKRNDERNTNIKGDVHVVPTDFDRTPSILESWDQRMLDHDVGKLMKLMLDPIPGADFFEKNVRLAECFFSPPHSDYAKRESRRFHC